MSRTFWRKGDKLSSFQPNPDFWCGQCLESRHDDCDGETLTSATRNTYYKDGCSCPCNKKLTRSERFELRKMLATKKVRKKFFETEKA